MAPPPILALEGSVITRKIICVYTCLNLINTSSRNVIYIRREDVETAKEEESRFIKIIFSHRV